MVHLCEEVDSLGHRAKWVKDLAFDTFKHPYHLHGIEWWGGWPTHTICYRLLKRPGWPIPSVYYQDVLVTHDELWEGGGDGRVMERFRLAASALSEWPNLLVRE